MEFTNRQQAGELVAQKLKDEHVHIDLILGLARGGVVVAHGMAKRLKIPFDVLVVKKIPSPIEPELGLGAVAPDSVSFVDWKMAQRTAVDEAYIRNQITELNVQIKQKSLLYRKGKKPMLVKDKAVLLVDDGMATGATMGVAVKWLRSKKARKILVAIPVASHASVGKLKPEVDTFIVLDTPGDFSSVGQFYKDFSQISDEEVIELLH